MSSVKPPPLPLFDVAIFGFSAPKWRRDASPGQRPGLANDCEFPALKGRHYSGEHTRTAPSGLGIRGLSEPRAALPLVADPGLTYGGPVGAEIQ